MKLFDHQTEAVNFAVRNSGNVALFMDIGTGKTRTALEIFNYYRENGDPDLRLLVICPISLLEGAWGQDIKRFSNFKYHNCHKDGIPQGQVAPSITLINFEGLLSEERRASLIKLIQKPGANWMCVIDESGKLKNFKALTTKTILKMRNLFKHKMVMSGCPAPNSEMEYFGQMEFVRPGIFGSSFYKFRNTFFHLQRGKQIMNGNFFASKEAMATIFSKGFKYEITDANRRKLMAMIAKYSHFAKKKDCLDLPEQIDEDRIVEMGPKQKKAYREMKTQLITEIKGEDITAPIALARLMKLRQITAGFAYSESGSPIAIGEEPKIRELMDVIEEAGPQQIIIWANFHWEILRICHELRKLFPNNEEGDKQIVTLYGGTKDRDGSITAFQEGRARFLVAHPRSAAHGLTLIGASIQIFFSLNYSSEDYIQMRGRSHRPGQKNVCTYIHLLCRDTIDEDILDILRKKKTAADVIFKFTS